MFKRKITISFLFFFFLFAQNSFSEDEYIRESIEIIKKDIKTLEKAVYSDFESVTSNSSTEFNQSAEDALTRHLLKLSEIENQFKELTNKFEEINFKLDKLSSRLSKVQADNQIRFLQLEDNKLVLKSEESKDKILPGSSEPQDLGSISYKDTSTEATTQQTQSIDTTSTVVSEIIES